MYSYRPLVAPRKRSRQRSWNVSAHALSPCKRHHSWQCGQKSLTRLHPLPRFHYRHKSCLFSDHYRCHHLLRAHPCPSSLLRRHVATPLPLLVRSCPILSHYHCCCPPSNRLLRCHHRCLQPAPLLSLTCGHSPSSLSSLQRSVLPSRPMSLLPLPCGGSNSPR